MPQISVNLSLEDLETLEKVAEENALRPLTFASAMLTTAIRGQRDPIAKEKWENFKMTTNVHCILNKKEPIPSAVDAIERDFGTPQKVGRFNPETQKWEE